MSKMAFVRKLSQHVRKWTKLGANKRKFTSNSFSYQSSQYTYHSHTIKPNIPLFIKCEQHKQNIGLVDQHGCYTYKDILTLSNILTDAICDSIPSKKDDVKSSKIAFLCSNDISYVICLLSSWMSGGVAVPLCKTHPTSELQYYLEDSDAKIIISTEEYSARIEPCVEKLGIKHMILKEQDYNAAGIELSKGNAAKERHSVRWNRLNNLSRDNKYKKKDALFIYTSGTTGRPKGVVHTFGSLQAQMNDMISEWKWTASDTCLHVLPLHHVHGVVNMLMTPMYVGATVVMLPKFDPSQVWDKLLGSSNSNHSRINVFMAVPTIYAKLIENYESDIGFDKGPKQENVKALCSSRIRLMVSGSAALPQSILEKWKDISGHTLLERYGMTEAGMILTNPLRGTRTPGSVGLPFPQVSVCIARPNVYSENGYDVIAQGNKWQTKISKDSEGESGELYVKGPNLFKEYWKRPEATQETFTKDGWFKTGDTAIYENGVYKILGRTSVDIIKSGGYKISALDVERHLLENDNIRDVAVLGLPDHTWGQRVAAVIVMKDGADVLTKETLSEWCKDRLPPYCIPTVVKVVETMPRNAMGKVNKKDFLNTIFSKEAIL